MMDAIQDIEEDANKEEYIAAIVAALKQRS